MIIIFPLFIAIYAAFVAHMLDCTAGQEGSPSAQRVSHCSSTGGDFTEIPDRDFQRAFGLPWRKSYLYAAKALPGSTGCTNETLTKTWDPATDHCAALPVSLCAVPWVSRVLCTPWCCFRPCRTKRKVAAARRAPRRRSCNTRSCRPTCR